MLRQSIPVLHVRASSVVESFYRDLLGFEIRFQYRQDPSIKDPCYSGVSREGAGLHLSSFSGDGIAGNAVYLITDDVDALHSEFKSKGVDVGLEPTDQTWGNREMYIVDPDGNSLRFVQESTPGHDE